MANSSLVNDFIQGIITIIIISINFLNNLEKIVDFFNNLTIYPSNYMIFMTKFNLVQSFIYLKKK